MHKFQKTTEVLNKSFHRSNPAKYPHLRHAKAVYEKYKNMMTRYKQSRRGKKPGMLRCTQLRIDRLRQGQLLILLQIRLGCFVAGHSNVCPSTLECIHHHLLLRRGTQPYFCVSHWLKAKDCMLFCSQDDLLNS
ncbi:TPA: hypothetical protein ACH3X2_002621 [Trebouxia sp. C0005]